MSTNYNPLQEAADKVESSVTKYAVPFLSLIHLIVSIVIAILYKFLIQGRRYIEGTTWTISTIVTFAISGIIIFHGEYLNTLDKKYVVPVDKDDEKKGPRWVAFALSIIHFLLSASLAVLIFFFPKRGGFLQNHQLKYWIVSIVVCTLLVLLTSDVFGRIQDHDYFKDKKADSPEDSSDKTNVKTNENKTNVNTNENNATPAQAPPAQAPPAPPQ